MTTKLKEMMGKLAQAVCAPCEPKVKEAHGHVISKIQDVKKQATVKYDESMVKVMEVHGKASTKYADHVKPTVQKVHGHFMVTMTTINSATNKVSAVYTDNVAPHVDKASNKASLVLKENVVPAAKIVGAKAAMHFNETVVPKVQEHATNLKEHPKLKELNDKASVKYQEGKAHATTKCTEFTDKVVAAICTPKVREVHGKVKESQVHQKLSKAYDDHGAPKIKSFKETMGVIATSVSADLASRMNSIKGEEVEEEVVEERVDVIKEEVILAETPEEHGHVEVVKEEVIVAHALDTAVAA